MTDIEKQAIALVNEAFREPYYKDWSQAPQGCLSDALCRAIEQHEAYKQEVSDAAEQAVAFLGPQSEKHPRGQQAISLARFILPKPVDPLVEAWKQQYPDDPLPEASCANLRAAIEKRGGKITWGEG